MARKLGKDYKPISPSPNWQPIPPVADYNIGDVMEAILHARANLARSPAERWMMERRGITRYTATTYGLGYGIAKPPVSSAVVDSAKNMKLAGKWGKWWWEESVIYADPPSNPDALLVRFLPDEYASPRKYPPRSIHQAWGILEEPLGAWRGDERTKGYLVVEGLFDMLVGSQYLNKYGLFPEIVAVYTKGSHPSFAMREWMAERDAMYFLVQDMDEAGNEWTDSIVASLDMSGRKYRVFYPPDGKDPDEAFLSGWWPNIS
jgi:hypothetical protein